MEKLIIHSSESAPLQQPWKPNPKLLIGSEPSQRRPSIWDCGSSLYDSFELDSFQRRLDTARHARSLSLPHLGGADHRLEPPPMPPKHSSSGGSRISRLLKKLVRSVFFRGKSKSKALERVDDSGKARWFVVLEDGVVFEKGNGVLSTIPEAPEAEKKAELVASEIDVVPRKISSERFAARSVSMNVISSRGLVLH